MSDATQSGTELDDSLTGDDGANTLLGLAGNDTLIGGNGADRLDGGDGNDILDAGSNTQSNGTEMLLGRGGDDTYLFSSGTYKATVMTEGSNSGSADSVVFGDMSLGDFDAVTINGTTIVFEFVNAYGQNSVVTIQGFGNIESFVFADGAILTAGDLALSAGSTGDDTLTALDTGSVLYGGAGADSLIGGIGADSLIGGDGDDQIFGGDGGDTLSGAAGDNVLSGGDGSDSYVASQTGGHALILGETGTSGSADTVIFASGYGTLAQPTLTADGHLLLVVTGPDGQSNSVEIAAYDAIESYVFADGTVIDAAQMLGLIATDGNDTIQGLDRNDTLTGMAGSDRIYGNDGDDVLSGGDGRDFLFGGEGDDTLHTSANEYTNIDEYLRGGNGNDTYIISRDTGRVMILGETASSGNADVVIFSGIDFDDITGASIASNGDLRLTLINAGGDEVRITIRDYQAIERFEFADGIVLTGETITMLATTDVSASDTSHVDLGALDAFDGHNGLTPIALGQVQNPDGSDYAFAHSYHVPNGMVHNMVDGDVWTSASLTNAIEYVVGDDSAQIISNLNSGGDIFFGNGGDDYAHGGGGADYLNGGAGNDTLYGGTYSDMVVGGAGNDLLTGDQMNDLLFGGDGDDTLEGGLALDVLFGGAGNDVIISRSDSGEPDVRVDGVDPVVVTDDPSSIDISGAASNDALFGGSGSDLFVFEFTVGAVADPEVLLAGVMDLYTLYDDMGTADVLDDIYTINGELDGAGNPKQIKLTDIPIDWTVITGLNDDRHDHWMDGIGNDVIHDFTVGEDQIVFIGHTVAIEGIEYVDTDGNGVLDTVITIGSDHVMDMGGMVTPLAHDNDLLGTVTLIDVQLSEADLAYSVVDVPVHGHDVMELTGDAMIDAYLLTNYTDETGAFLSAQELIPMFSSFETIGQASSYYSSNLGAINTYGDDVPTALFGSDGADVMQASDLGSYLAGGAGDDILLGSDTYAIQFGRDFIEGGDGDDLIYGSVQDDFLFGGEGDDTILGGGVMEMYASGTTIPVGDEDLIFGGAGNDTLAGGPSMDWIEGGDGDDTLLSASDIYIGNYTSDYVQFGGSTFEADDGAELTRDFRTLDDYLIGGDGADSFVFDVLTSEVDGAVIQTSFGVDTIYDFDASEGDTLSITVHGASAGSAYAEVSAVLVDGIDSAVINVISTTSDNLATTIDPISGDPIVETDYTGSVGEILLIGVSAAEAEALLDLAGGFTLSEPALGAAAYYEDILGF
ncbi:calcium-binding protein [Flavimaricola marinus]|uniref:Poly(Beta-D-mannuronate) C5 epimerase 1 n=1 Tax=Flavimaricola marinus TaxID=1819565 RepID=A0A238LAG5_9RHOB|nr:calcium-binding protein [Flavimaricola marinus]SMY06553.1 Poly(beta-D-mannuronate) C5 epimerase 1 [Flavimaricola marinus]